MNMVFSVDYFKHISDFGKKQCFLQLPQDQRKITQKLLEKHHK